MAQTVSMGSVTNRDKFDFVVFNGKNYYEWRRSLDDGMTIIGLDDLLDLLTTGLPDTPSAQQTRDAKRMMSYLTRTVMASIAAPIRKEVDPKKALERLEAVYRTPSMQRIAAMETAWNRLAKRPDETMDDFICRIYQLRDELDDLGQTKTDVALQMRIYTCLPPEYSTDVKLLQNRHPPPSLTDIQAALNQAESDLLAQSPAYPAALAHAAGPDQDGRGSPNRSSAMEAWWAHNLL